MGNNKVYNYKRNAVCFAAGLNFILVLMKLAGWYFGSSSALLSDALDSLTDLISDLIVLVGVWFSSKPPDEKHPFGHLKAESIVTVVAGLLIITLAISTIVRATELFLLESVSVPASWTAIVALVSTFICLLGWRVLRYWGKRTHSSALIASSEHKFADAGTSVAAFIGISSTVLLGFRYGDLVASIIVALWVMRTGLKIVFLGGSELMDSAPDAQIRSEIENVISSISGVTAIKSLRARKSGGKVFVDAEVDVAPELSVVDGHIVAHAVQDEIEKLPFVGGALVHTGPSENIASIKKVVETEIENVCRLIPDIIEFHGIGVFATARGLLAVVDIVVQEDMTIKEAHRIAERVRNDILVRVSDVIDAVVHVDFCRDES